MIVTSPLGEGNSYRATWRSRSVEVARNAGCHGLCVRTTSDLPVATTLTSANLTYIPLPTDQVTADSVAKIDGVIGQLTTDPPGAEHTAAALGPHRTPAEFDRQVAGGCLGIGGGSSLSRCRGIRPASPARPGTHRWGSADFEWGELDQNLTAVSTTVPAISTTYSAGTNAWVAADIALTPADTTATVAVTAGSLTYVSAPGSLPFPGVTLGAATQTATQPYALDLADEIGSGGGWKIQASGGVLTSGSATLPAAQVTGAPTQACDYADQCVVATTTAGYPYTMSTSPGDDLQRHGGYGHGTGDGHLHLQTVGTGHRVLGNLRRDLDVLTHLGAVAGTGRVEGSPAPG